MHHRIRTGVIWTLLISALPVPADNLQQPIDIDRFDAMLSVREDWLASMPTEVPANPHDYFDLLILAQHTDLDNDEDRGNEIPLSFNIDSSLQELAPFLAAYGLPVGNGSRGARNLVVVQDEELLFAPADVRFLDTIRYLRQLWEAGVIDRRVTSDARFNPLEESVFSVTTEPPPTMTDYSPIDDFAPPLPYFAFGDGVEAWEPNFQDNGSETTFGGSSWTSIELTGDWQEFHQGDGSRQRRTISVQLTWLPTKRS